MEPALFLAILMFVGASISDLETRRVPNRYWIPFLVAVPFLAPWGLTAWLFAAGTAGFFYLLWRMGLFGGADAKGLMVVAMLTPRVPELLDHRTVLAFDALVNATLLMVTLPILFLAWNVARGDLRLPAALLGARMDLGKARDRHLWPMQEADGRWRYLHRPGVDVSGIFAAHARAGATRVWVTPKIPFMVPLTAGLILAAGPGNLALWAMAEVLS